MDGSLTIKPENPWEVIISIKWLLRTQNSWHLFRTLRGVKVANCFGPQSHALNAMSMNKQGCPICGYTEITVLDEFNCTTFEICECCGSESGVEYDQHSTQEHLAKVRSEWVNATNCAWWGEQESIPNNWNPKKQMEVAGIEIPQ
ncbi:hypothetical protein [Litoribrevibacter albus]|uniref:hypothetical protein n=1 Tax=Litoribrevibacter albus TaxID=1473156 RepID=UPI0024E1397B|nr:hypothetical protein [Litoribrevibacter albus]